MMNFSKAPGRAVALAIAACGLAGCANMRDVLQSAPPGPVARQCDATVEQPTTYRDVFTDDRATRLTVSNEGGWCGTYVQLMRDIQLTDWTTGALTEPPAHGSVRLRRGPTVVHVEYQPQPGYVGADSFTVRLQPGFSSRVTTVQVVPAAGARGVPSPEIGVTSTTMSTERRFPDR
jgi:hypothetical protein